MPVHRSFFASSYHVFTDLYFTRNINQFGKCKVTNLNHYFLSYSWHSFYQFRIPNFKFKNKQFYKISPNSIWAYAAKHFELLLCFLEHFFTLSFLLGHQTLKIILFLMPNSPKSSLDFHAKICVTYPVSAKCNYNNYLVIFNKQM